MHKSADVTAGEYNVERLDEVLLSERRTPRWRIVVSFFVWIVKNSGELVKLVVMS